MTPQEAEEIMPVIAAFAKGETIQCLMPNGSWSDAPDPVFRSCFRYRIKPVTSYRPWKFEEIPVGKVVRPKTMKVSRHMITDANAHIVYMSVASRNTQQMLDDYTMDDGSPCGVLES